MEEMAQPVLNPQKFDQAMESHYRVLLGYIVRRYPQYDVTNKTFKELVSLKTELEGPVDLRYGHGEIASVMKM